MTLVYGQKLIDRRSTRAAILPYTIVNMDGEDKILFLFGIHSGTNEITDFGGGVKKYENDLIASFRELNEESKGIFEKSIFIPDLNTCIAAVKDTERTEMSVIFVPIYNRNNCSENIKKFKNISKSGECYNEIEKLVWVKETDFTKILNLSTTSTKYTMWSRIRKFYNDIYDYNLRQMLYIRYLWFTPHFSIKN